MPRTTCLIFLVLFAGCRFLSSDEEPEPLVFAVTVAGVDLEGTAEVTVQGDQMRVYGEFLHPDSSTRFVEIVLDGFEGERLYALPRETAQYGVLTDSVGALTYGVSLGHDQDLMRISTYEPEEGFVEGELFFFAQAVRPFEGVPRGDPFAVSGQFRTEIDEASSRKVDASAPHPHKPIAIE